MSDTPITDAKAFKMLADLQSGTREVVDAEVARELERKLASRPEVEALERKLILDTGHGCSICRQTPVVNVSGTYWLCGGCVDEKLHGPQKP